MPVRGWTPSGVREPSIRASKAASICSRPVLPTVIPDDRGGWLPTCTTVSSTASARTWRCPSMAVCRSAGDWKDWTRIRAWAVSGRPEADRAASMADWRTDAIQSWALMDFGRLLLRDFSSVGSSGGMVVTSDLGIGFRESGTRDWRASEVSIPKRERRLGRRQLFRRRRARRQNQRIRRGRFRSFPTWLGPPSSFSVAFHLAHRTADRPMSGTGSPAWSSASIWLNRSSMMFPAGVSYSRMVALMDSVSSAHWALASVMPARSRREG